MPAPATDMVAEPAAAAAADAWIDHHYRHTTDDHHYRHRGETTSTGTSNNNQMQRLKGRLLQQCKQGAAHLGCPIMDHTFEHRPRAVCPGSTGTSQ